MTDGPHSFPNKLWLQDYIFCHKNRTIQTTKCPTTQYFNPRLNICTDVVEPGKRYQTLTHEWWWRSRLFIYLSKMLAFQKCLFYDWQLTFFNTALYTETKLSKILTTVPSFTIVPTYHIPNAPIQTSFRWWHLDANGFCLPLVTRGRSPKLHVTPWFSFLFCCNVEVLSTHWKIINYKIFVFSLRSRVKKSKDKSNLVYFSVKYK